MHGRRYRLSVKNERYGIESTYKYADLMLEQEEGTNTSQVFGAEMDVSFWEVLNVTMIELGEWVQDIVALAELFAARRERDRLSFELQHTLPKVKNLK